MTEKSFQIIENLSEKDFESFKKNLFALISEKLQESLEEKDREIRSSILEAGDAAAAAAEADAEKQALFVDPMMAKEFFLVDFEYKGHTITLKSLGTGIGKPVISYIDNEQYEVFTDKELAKRESKEAVDRMVEKGIDNIQDLRKTPAQMKKDAEEAKKAEKMKEQQKAEKQPAK